MWFKLLQQIKSIDINYDPIPWDNIYCAIIFKFIAQGNKEVLNGIRAHTWQARPWTYAKQMYSSIPQIIESTD